MKGFVLGGFDIAPVLRDDLPAPAPGDDQLLVRVHASSVNPVDAAIASGMLRGMVEYERFRSTGPASCTWRSTTRTGCIGSTSRIRI